MSLVRLSLLFQMRKILPRFLKVSAAAITLMIVIGCSSKHITENHYDQVGVPAGLPAGPVALIITGSVIETIEELGAYNRYYKEALTARLYTENIRRAYVETSQPHFSVEGVTRVLEGRFGEVRSFQSSDDAARSGFPLIATLSMKTQLIDGRGSEPTSSLSLAFQKSNGRHLGTIHGTAAFALAPLWPRNKRESEIVAEIRQQGEVQRQALELLEQRLKEIPAE